MITTLSEAELDKIAEKVAAKLQSATAYIDQEHSPLGRRRHIALARANPSQCRKVGRNYLCPAELVRTSMRMEPSDLAEELGL